MWRPELHTAAVGTPGNYISVKQHLQPWSRSSSWWDRSNSTVYGGCLCCYIGTRTNSTKLQPFAYQNSKKSLKNLSGDIWMVMKSELAIFPGDCCFSNGVKEKKKSTLKCIWSFFLNSRAFFFSPLCKNNTPQESSKLSMGAKLLVAIWNEEMLSLWDLDFSHFPAVFPPFPYPLGSIRDPENERICSDWGPNVGLLFADTSWESASN